MKKKNLSYYTGTSWYIQVHVLQLKGLTFHSANIEVIIAVGGEDDKVVLRSVESFDPTTHHWRTLACLPFAVSKHGLVVTGN